MDNLLLKRLLILAGGAISIYALRSYGYQKECAGYKKGALVAINAYEKQLNKEKENNENN